MVDLHKLRIFAVVARTGNFTRAAELLHMTQPTVSQQLAALEAQVGAPLIDRQTRRQRLTPAGEALLPFAERLLALADEALQTARAAAGVASSTLRLGVGHTLATYLLPGLLRGYRERFGHFRSRISVGNTAELLDMVAEGAVELALVGSPAEREGVSTAPFMRDRLVVIVAPGDPWADRTEVGLDELRGRTLLTREPGSALHATVERLLGTEALADDEVILLGETEAIKRSVEAGIGVALVQAIAVEREVASGTLRALPLSGANTERTYSVAWARGRQLSPPAQALLEELERLGAARD
ncbi:MAG: LysR family transcriptional regulator [Chloroflexota bacterium]|nr:MAG: LysR family transcriptional regulator [Chloroflexota bacterium]